MANRGFTLVEMLVVVSIIGIITGIMVLRYNQFDSQFLLRGLAYDVALSIREAQALSISVMGSGGSFEYGYGVHFTPGTTYLIFRDSDEGDDYDLGEEVSIFTIGRNNFIGDLCVNGKTECGKTELDIVFKRPESRARMRSVPAPAVSISSAEIEVHSSTGNQRTVVISPTGQISVQ